MYHRPYLMPKHDPNFRNSYTFSQNSPNTRYSNYKMPKSEANYEQIRKLQNKTIQHDYLPELASRETTIRGGGGYNFPDA